jgi:hypothetical protein
MDLPWTTQKQPMHRRTPSSPLLSLLWLHTGSQGFQLTFDRGASPRVVRLVVFVILCSALDALFTLLHIQQGGSEANPLMALVLAYGTIPFVGLKMGMTGLGTIILATYEHCRLGLKSLQLMALVYAGLMVYHAIIFFSGF